MELDPPQKKASELQPEGLQQPQKLDFERVDPMDVMLSDVDMGPLLASNDLDLLSDRDRETLARGLTVSMLNRALSCAREVEALQKPRDHLERTGTLEEYRKAVLRLKREDQDEDALRAFQERDRADEHGNTGWGSNSARCQARAAMHRFCADDVLDLLPALANLATLQDLGGRATYHPKERHGALRHWYDANFAGKLEAVSDEIKGSEILAIARAACWFEEYQPDPHGRRARAEGALAKAASQARALRSQAPQKEPVSVFGYEALEVNNKKKASRPHSKRHTFAKLRGIERRRREADPDYDWRTAVWREIETDPTLCDERRAAMAVLCALGTRPVAVTQREGVEAYLLKAGVDEDDKLALRIPWTKKGDMEFLEEGGSELRIKLSDHDRRVIEDLKEDQQVRGYNEKGQAYVYVELDCATPELRWLARHVGRHGVARLPDVTAYDDNEKEIVRGLAKRTARRALIKWPDRYADPAAAVHKSERDKKHLQVQQISDRFAACGRRAIPELKSSKIKLTGYVYRHAMSADLKEAVALAFDAPEGLDPEDVSRAMAHRSGRMASVYGTSKQGGRRHNRAAVITKVQAAKPAIRNAMNRNPGNTPN